MHSVSLASCLLQEVNGKHNGLSFFLSFFLFAFSSEEWQQLTAGDRKNLGLVMSDDGEFW